VYLDRDTQPRHTTDSATVRYVASLEDRVRSLERRLDEAAERDREQRRIIAALTSRIPALPAAEAAAQDDEPSGEAHDTPTTRAGDSEADTRSWWRRVFGV
jgi:hypothetical protein